jgi:hypothetical protein
MMSHGVVADGQRVTRVQATAGGDTSAVIQATIPFRQHRPRLNGRIPAPIYRFGLASISAKTTTGHSPVRNDTDLYNDYVVRNKVYMYDAPGNLLGLRRKARMLFEVWAESSDGKIRISQWYYCHPHEGIIYPIDPPAFVDKGESLWDMYMRYISTGQGGIAPGSFTK